MAWSTLKRRTPLKSGGFLKRTPLKRKPPVSVREEGDNASEPRKKAKKSRRSSKSALVEKLDRVFSLYIRLRDAMDGGNTVCISCGRLFPFEQMQAGHYWSRHHMITRWDERNVHSECAFDNCNNPDHLDGYTANLKAKIGEEAFDELAVLHNRGRSWSDWELEEMIERYTAAARALAKEKGINIKI